MGKARRAHTCRYKALKFMYSYFTQLLALIFSFAYLPFRGRARVKIEEAQKIKKAVFIQRAKLGDMVCTTPLFHLLKNNFSGVELTVAGNSTNEKLLEHNKDIDEYVVFEDYGGMGSDFWRLVKKLRKKHPEFGAIVVPDLLGLAALFLGGVKMISAPKITNGASAYETTSYKLLRHLVTETPLRMNCYMPREYLNILEVLGIFSDDTTKRLAYSGVADREASVLIEEKKSEGKKIVGVTPTAGSKMKEWPAEKFAEVANYLIKKWNAHVFIIGGPMDIDTGHGLYGLIENGGATDLSGRLTIDVSKALISKFDLLIGVDTGPIYIAEAFGVPTVDIIGPVSELEQPPIGPLHKVVYLTDRVAPEVHIMNARVYNEKEAKRQIDGITVSMVVSKLEELFNSEYFLFHEK